MIRFESVYFFHIYLYNYHAILFPLISLCHFGSIPTFVRFQKFYSGPLLAVSALFAASRDSAKFRLLFRNIIPVP